MSTRHHGEGLSDAVGEEPKASAAPRNQQSNGSAGGGGEGVPVRRSWRPCQMLGQDPHPHHPPIPHQGMGRGPSRHRRRPPPGHGLSRLGEGMQMDVSNNGQLPRPGVARYRRQGEHRVKVHRQRPLPRDVQQTHNTLFQGQQSSDCLLTEQKVPNGPAVGGHPTVPQCPLLQHTLDCGAPGLTEGGVSNPTHHTLCPDPKSPCHDLPAAIPKKPWEERENVDEAVDEEEEDGYSSSITQSVSSQSGCDVGTDKENQREVAHGEENPYNTNLEEGNHRGRCLGEDGQGAETNEPCSDTESTASLSMEAPPPSPPLHQSPLTIPLPFSPPPLQSEHSDQCSDEFSPSPTHQRDVTPDDESYTDSPLSNVESFTFTDSYPKTYAEFYNESYPQSESMTESLPEPYAKSYPQSFPKPLKLIKYNDSDEETHRTSEVNLDEPYTEFYSETYGCRQRDCVYTDAPNTDPLPPSSSPGSVVGMSRNIPDWQGHSVGSRLHHYDDTTSDGEGESPDSRSVQGEAQSELPSSGQLGSGESTDKLDVTGLTPPADGLSRVVRASGDAISLAIRDIRVAIKEVKTKTVRSPYTPDEPTEPVWVMRQASPAEETYPTEQPVGDNANPVSPSSHYKPVTAPEPAPVPDCVPVPSQEPTSPVITESSRTKQVQQREPPRSLSIEEMRRCMPAFPTYVEVPGPCDPEDLIDGIIFAASYLGSTHLLSERTPSKSARMQQAQEAMSRVRTAQKQAKNRKKTECEVPSSAEVDLFMSTQRIKVLNADTQESMMDLPLRTISYIADIGSMVVLMARGKMVRSRSAQEHLNQPADQSVHTNSPAHDECRQYKMVCHVFESEDAQLIAQSIGQAFSVAYQEFLRANGIDPEDLSQREYSDLLNTQDMYNDDLIHFSKSENCRDVYIEKQRGEMLGVVIVESGWGSILPTVIIAGMMHSGPAEKSGRLNIGDQIMTINGTSLVGLPLSTCQSIIKGLKAQSRIKLNIVRCPPVTMVLIRRPDLRYQLGFSVQNGIICSLMRGGIAERGGVRVGHRIIQINGQSVVATPHEKIVHILSNAVGEIHMKTMPAAMYRLLTAQEQPVYI
ncbi:hypothetical protein UPYG_G00281280 [Umbra pygmaea]|uniref:Amyloid beta (A4) precursor protein-binding, family A, member 1b n=1 Tax=Umbra pygmaea TaxID=75934 RepID=A0ABD0W7I5_UMBPY